LLSAGWRNIAKSVGEVAFPPVPIRVAGLLPDNAPNQYFGFQYGAISQVQPNGCSPDLMTLQIWHPEISRGV
jgi:hypothetical protein